MKMNRFFLRTARKNKQRAANKPRKSSALAGSIAMLVGSVAALLTAPSAKAVTYYWDDNGATAGFGTAGASLGTWAAPTTGTAAGWSTSAAGTDAFAGVTSTTADLMNFGDATNGLASGTITVSGAVASGNMVFGALSGAITLTGGSIGFGNSSITVNNATNTINSTLTGGNALSKAGTGILVLGGTNTRTGKLTISAGTISVSTIGNYGVAGGLGQQASTTVDQLGAGANTGTLLYTGAIASTNRQFLIGDATAANTGGATFTNNGAGLLTFNATNFNPTITGITATRTLTFNGSADIAVTGIIQNNAAGGLVALTKSGTNVLTLSGVNTYSGTTTLSLGTLRATTSASALGAGALSLGGGTLQLANDTGLNFARNTTVTANSTITADRLTSAATSTTHTLGTLSIGAQTLTITRGTNITGAGIGGITFGATTISGASSAAVFSPGANTTLTLGAVTGTTPTITMAGAGTLVLSAAFTSTTALTINSGGTVTLNTNNSTGSAALTVNGTLNFNSGQIFGVLNGSGTINESGNWLYTNTNLSTGSFSGTINGTGGYLKQGTGTQTLSGLSSYDGSSLAGALTTHIQAGALSINTIQNVGVGNTSALGAPTTATTGLIGIGNTSTTGTLIYTGAVTSTDRQIQIGFNTATPAVGDTGGAIIQADGASNAALTFSNATFNVQTNAATGAGANRTLTLQGSSSGANTISGIIRNNLVSGTGTGTATVALTKSGTGTWALGGVNTYTGATAINQGTLQFNAINTGISAVTVSGTAGNNATLGGTGTVPGTVALAVGTAFTGAAINPGTVGGVGTLTLSNATGFTAAGFTRLNFDLNTAQTIGGGVNDLIASTGLPSLTAGASGTQVNLNALTPLTLGAYTLINGYTGAIANAPVAGTLTGDATKSILGILNNASSLQAVIGSAAPAAAFWSGAMNGNWNGFDASANTNWRVSATGADTNALPASTTNVTFGTTTPAATNLTTTLGQAFSINSLTFASSISTATSIAGPSALTVGATGITNSSSAGGAVTISAPVTLGAAQSWTNNNTTDAMVVSGNITGSGLLTKAGAGALTLSGTNTGLTGGVTLSAGTLNINSASALGTVAGTFTVSGASTIDATVGPITLTANNPVALNSNFTYGGTQNLNLGTGAVTMNASRSIAANGTGTLTLGGGITGATFGITKAGAGTLSLGGVIGTTTGGLAVTNGTLIVGNAANTFTGNITVDGASSVLQMTSGSNGTATAAPLGIFTGGTGYKTVTLTNAGIFRPMATYNDNIPTASLPGNGYVFVIGTGGGAFDVPTGVTLTIDDGSVAGTATTNAQIQGAGTLTKTGVGTLSLGNGTSNFAAFTGAIIVNAGTLTTGTVSTTPLGTIAAGTTINSGATLNAGAAVWTAAEPLTLAGTGLASAPAGALTASGAATWIGPITIAAGGATIGGGAGALTLSSAATINGTAGSTTLATGAGALTVNGTINTGSNVLTISHAGGRITTAGVISGVGSVQVNGTSTGDWVSSPAHIYSGGTTLNTGSQTVPGISSVGVGAGVTSGAFGTSTLILNGGAMRGGTASPFTVGNTVTLQADTTFYTIASEKSLIFSGPVTITGGSRTLTSTVGTTVAGTTVDFQGAIGDGSNGFGLTKAGAGNLTLSGANTYTGTTTVNAGFLGVTGSLANNSNLSVTPTAAAGATVSFINNAANTPANFTTLSLGSATGTSFIGLDLGTSSDSIATTAVATAGNNIVFHLNAASGFGAGSYNLVSANSGLTAGGAAYSLGTLPGGYTYVLNPGDGLVQLTATAATAGGRYWRGNLGTSWATISGTNTNWATDAAGTVVSAATPGAGDTVFFSATGATGPAITTTVDNSFTINDLQFLSAPTGVSAVTINPGVNPGTFGLGTVTLAPSSASVGLTLAQGAGAVTIAASIVLGAPQTWSVDSSTPGSGTASSLIVSGAISGLAANGLTFTTTAGTTPIILSSASGTSIYSGPSTVSAATIVQGGATNAFSPNTAWTVNGTLNTGAFNQATGSLVGGSGFVQNGSVTNATLTLGSDNLASGTFAGTIQNGSTGTLGITKAGTGIQILSGTNSYTGATIVNVGTLKAGSITAFGLGALTVTSPGILDLGGFNNTVASIAASTGTITDSSSPGSGGILKVNAAATAIAGLITGSVGIQYANTNGGNAFGSNVNNTYSGGTYLGLGSANNTFSARFSPGASTTVGNGVGVGLTAGIMGTGPIYIGGATTDAGQIYISAASVVINNPITYNSIMGTDVVGATRIDTTSTFAGVQTAGLSAITWGSHIGTGTLNVTGKITGSGTFTGTITNPFATLGIGQVISTNAGLIIGSTTSGTSITAALNNPSSNNDYTGDTWITNKGILRTDAVNQLPSGSGTGNMYLTGTFNMQGFSQATGLLSGSGTIDGISGTPTLTIGGNNATGLTFSGIIRNTAGALGVTKTGTGTQTLSGPNTFSGALNVNGGTLAFGAANNLGDATATNTIGINGGILSYTGAGAVSLVATRVVTLGASHGTIDTSNGAGALTLSGGVTAANNNLTKTGLGSLILAATSNLGTGTVAVSAGALIVNTTLTSSTTAVASTATLGGTGTLTSAVTISSGGMLSPATGTTGGTITIGSLTLDAGSLLAYEFGGTNDLVTVTTASGLTLNGGALSLYAAGGVSPLTVNGTYDLFNYTTPFGGSLTNLTVANSQGGKTYAINDTGSIIQLVLGSAVTSDWSGTIDGLWTNDGVGNNWNGGLQPNSLGAVANFGNIAVTPQTVTLNGGKTVGSILFDNTNSFTIGTNSDAITLDNGIAAGAISATTGSHTITAPIALNVSANVAPGTGTTITFGGIISGIGRSLTFSGAGTSVLNAVNTYSGGTTLSAGTLNLGNDSALGSGALTITAGAIDNTKGSLLTNANNNAQNWNGSFIFTGTESMDLGTGAVTLGTTPTITTNNAAKTLTVGGAIGDGVFSLGFTKAGPGTLALSGTSTYNGATSITAGTLSLTGSLTGGGAISVSGGTLSLTGSISGGSAISTSGTGILSESAAGVISGASTVTQGSTGTSVLAGTNTYTGLTTISGGVLRITNGSALGTTASGTTQSGTSALELDGTGGAITVGAEALTINGGGITNFGALRNIAGNNIYGGTVTLAAQSRINSDSGTLTLSNATAVNGTAQNLVVGGAGNITISGAIATTTGTVSKDGAGTLTLSGTNTYTGNTTVNAGTLNITGSLTGLAATTNLAYGTTAGNTIVNISGSGSINNYKNFTGANVAGSIAVMNQTGGSTSTLGTNGNDTQWVAQNGGYGYLNITGGTFNTGRFDAVGITGGGTAVVYVGGAGTFNNNSGDWLILVRTNGTGQLTVGPGGNLVRTAAVTTNLGITMDGTNSHGALNIAGGNVDTGTKPLNFGFGTSAASTGNRGFVNLAGGTLSVGSAIVQTNTTAGASYFEHFNFAGGTLKSNAAITWLPAASVAQHTLTATIYGAVTNNNNANTAFNTQIGATSNFVGGLTVDTNGFATTIAYPLSGASGFGVTQADIGNVSLLAGNSGYIGAPAVVFSAPASPTGVPASGYAVIDAGTVTGIVITNPGRYASGEAPTITLTGGGGSIAPITTPVLATANTSGGLTKLSAGTLTLSGANTFGGPVDIRGGVLSVTTLANGLSPSGLGQSSNAAANVLLNGGVLDYSGTVAASTDRNFTFAASNGGLGASGTTAGTWAVNTGNIVITPSLGAANFVLSGSGTGATGGGTLNGVLADGTGTTISLVKTGTGSWTLGGSAANTYTGLTTVTGSTATGGLTLAKTGGALAVPGNLTIGNGTASQSHVLFGGSEQISPTATVTLNGVNSGWSYLRLQGNTQTFGTIVETTPGFGVIETREGSGTFGLSNAIFNVASGTQTYQGYFRDINNGLDATNSLKMTKTGAGTLQWGAATGAGAAGTSTTARNYSGGTDIQNGTLQLLAPNTAGNSISIVGAGNVSLNGGATFAGTLDLNGLNAGITGLDGTTGTVLGQVVNNVSATTAILTIGNNGNNGNFAGVIRDNTSGTGIIAITKTGAGTQTLTGANTYSGTTTITTGTLQLGDGTTGNDGTIANSLSIVNNATLTYNRFGSASYGGVISGTGAVNKLGGGTQTLTGANTYNGTTTVSAGTLRLGTGGSLGSGSYAGALSIAGAATFENGGGTSQTLSGAVTGGGTLLLSGTGQIILNNASNAYGAINITGAGRVFINANAAALPAAATVSVSGGGILNFGTGASYANAITLGNNGGIATRFAGGTTLSNVTLPGTGTVILNNDDASTTALTISSGQTLTGPLTIQLSGSRMTTTTAALGNVTLSGVITGSGGLTFVSSGNIGNTNNLFGTGTLTLTNTNTYTGATTITSGTLSVATIGNGGVAGNLGQATNAATNLVFDGGTLLYTGATATSDRAFTINTGKTATIEVTNGLSLAGATGAATNGALTKTGAGTLTLTGASTYTGATSVSTGTLALSGTGDVNGSSGITISGSGAKLLQNSSTAVSPTVTLTQGTLTGDGTVNTVNVGAGTGGIISNNNGVAGAPLTIGTLTLAGVANINLFSNTTATTLVVGTLTNNSSLNEVTLTANNIGGWTNGSTYNIIGYTTLGGTGGYNFNKVANNLTVRQTPTWTDTGSIITLGIAGDIPYWVGDGDSKWNLASINNWKLLTANTYTLFITGDDALFNDNATGSTIVDIDGVSGVAPNTTTFNNSTLAYTLSGTGGSGITFGSLTKNGTASLTISSVNTYTGGTNINAGTVTMSGGGTLGTGSVLTLGGGALDLNTTTQTVGAVSVTAPAVSGNTIGNGSLTSTSYAASNTTGNAVIAANLLVNGAAGFTKTGAGTVTLSGANTYTGGTNINAGNVTISGSGTLGTGSALTLGGGALDLGTTTQTVGAVSITTPAASGDTISNGSLIGTSYAASNTTGNAIISANLLVNGAAGFTKTGAGTVTLSGANTYTGATNINAGTVTLSGSGTLGTGSALTLGGGQLDLGTLSRTVGAVSITAPAASGDTILNGSLSGTSYAASNTTGNAIISASLLANGAAGFTKTGLGTLTSTGGANYTGTTTVSGGKLAIQGAGTIGVTASTVAITVNAAAASKPMLLISGSASTVLNGKFAVGTGSNVGAVYQSGGMVNVSGNATADSFIGSGANGYGFYQLSGGSMNSTSFMSFGNAGTAGNIASGVFYQSGGAMTLSGTGWLQTGYQGNSAGVNYFTGGTTNITAGGGIQILGFGSLATSRGEVTINGGNVTSAVAVTFGNAAGGLGVGVLNLMSGTLQATNITKTATGATAILNFNGGTYKPTTNTSLTGLNNAYVFGGNAIIDTSVSSGTIGQVLLAPTGNGVATIPVATQGSGYIGAPYVSIVGGSSDATAVANMVDDGTGNGTFRIASITITNPGNSYASLPTVSLVGGGATTAATLGTITTAANTSGGLTKQGANTLTLSGANTYTGATTINAGTLKAGVVSVANVSGAFGINSAVTFADVAGATMDITGFNTQVGSLTGGGTTGGNITLGAATLTTGGNNTSPAAFAGAISGTGGLTKIGTGTQILSGLSATAASNYSGATTIDQGTLAISTTSPSLTGGLIFGAANASTNTGVLDVTGVAASATFGSLLVQTNTASNNTIATAPGKTLNISGNVTIGSTTASSLASLVTTGGGNLVVGTGATNTFQVGGTTGGTLAGTTSVDLSGLASLTVNYGSGGTFRLGDANTGSNAPTPSTLKLAAANTITVGNFRIGDGSGGAANHVLTLGNGANVINATTVNIGSAAAGIRSGGSMVFDGADTTGTLTLRGFAGGATRTVLNMVNSTGGTGVAMNSTVNLAGHTSDLMVSTLTMATRTLNVGGATATLTFDQGILDVTTLNMASRTGTGTGAATATVTLGDSVAVGVPTVTIGTITMAVNTSAGGISTANLNITGGNVAIGTGAGTAINMANAGAAVTATSDLNITGGTVTVTGNIIRTVGAGTETATLALNGASAILDMSGNNLTSLTGITYTAGLLKNLGVVNTGMALAGTGSRVFDQGASFLLGDIQGAITGPVGLGLTKQGAGILSLSGANTYDGVTTVSGGLLGLNHANALPGGIASTGGTSGLTFNGGVLGFGLSNFDRALGTGANQVQFTGSGGFAAFGTDRDVNLGGAAAGVTWNSGSFVPTGSSLILGNANSANTVTFVNPIDFTTATRSIQVENGSAATDAILSDVLSGAGGGLNKSGAGTLMLSGASANTYTGLTTVSGGTLVLNKTAGTAAIAGDASSVKTPRDVLVTGATSLLRWDADNQVGDNVSIRVSAGGTVNFNGRSETFYDLKNSGGTVIYSGTITITDPEWNAGSTNTIAGTSSFGFLDIRGGTNTINGTTGGPGSLTVGSLSGLNFFQNDAYNDGEEDIDASPSVINLTVNSDNATAGILKLAGNVTFGPSVGAGAPGTFSSSASITSGGAGSNPGQLDLNGATRIFTVGNSTAATDMLISAQIIGGATDGLTKAGAGTMVVSAANTYTGATTVNANGGTLEVTGSLSGTSGVTVNNSGTLLLNSTTNANNIVGNGTVAPVATNNTVNTTTGAIGTTPYTGTNGSTLAVGNTNAGGVTNTFSTLTLSGTSTLDFASGTTNNNFIFGSFTAGVASALFNNTAQLNITNWTGSQYDGQLGVAGAFGVNVNPGAADSGFFGNNQDRLLFTSDPGFGMGNYIAGINFSGFGPGATQVAFGSYYEIVPVPEPATTALIGAVALCALIGYRERRRFAGVRSRMVRK